MFRGKYSKIRDRLVLIEMVIGVAPTVVISYLVFFGFNVNSYQLASSLFLLIFTPFIVIFTIYYMNRIY
nr:MAG TPA: hypothetical protein [Caudoviricetes sp.]